MQQTIAKYKIWYRRLFGDSIQIAKDAGGFGILNPTGAYNSAQLTTLPLAQVSTSLAALQNFTGAYSGTATITIPRQFVVEVSVIGNQNQVDPNFTCDPVVPISTTTPVIHRSLTTVTVYLIALPSIG